MNRWEEKCNLHLKVSYKDPLRGLGIDVKSVQSLACRGIHHGCDNHHEDLCLDIGHPGGPPGAGGYHHVLLDRNIEFYMKRIINGVQTPEWSRPNIGPN